MADSRKKVLVRTRENAIHAGYLPAVGLLSAAGAASIQLLDLSARIHPVPLAEIRSIAFVRDFNLQDKKDPEGLARKVFLARPRAEGLWLRLTFLAGDTLEGLAPIDLSLLDGLLDDRGLFLHPPDPRSNTQRLFVPRSSIADLQLLAVVTTPSKTKAAAPRSTAPDPLQNELFPSPDPPDPPNNPSDTIPL